MDSYEQHPMRRTKWVGLWLRRSSVGNDYWASSVIKQMDVERFVEFCREPARLFCFRNQYKTTEKYPDATISLYRFIPKDQLAATVQQVDPQEPLVSTPEDSPF